MSELAGLKALITGGAAGIGLATAEVLAERGARVAIIDRNLPDAGDHPAFQADLADSAAVDRAVAGAAAALGGIDILVNSAGIDLMRPTHEVSDAEWDRVLSVNLSGPMRVCRAAFPWLRASGRGVIVNVSSGAGLRPIPDRAAYSASKAGLIMMTKSMAFDWAQYGIRANAICPGAVETALFAESYIHAPDPEAALAAIRARYPLNRIGTPRELAESIAYLAGPGAGYVTGVALAVDGGRSFH